MKYIDAEKLKTEIERRLYFDNNWIEGDKRRQMHTSGVSPAYYKRIGSKHACESILDFITSLQQEQPDVDLEKEMTAYIEQHFHIRYDETLEVGNDPLTTHDFEEIARHFYELGRNARKK